MLSMTMLNLRPATPADVPQILAFIRELAAARTGAHADLQLLFL